MTRRAVRVLVALVLLAAPAAAARAQSLQGAVVVVLPFENPQGTPRLHWLREGLAVLVEEALAAIDVEVIDRDERRLAYDRLQFPELATLSRASSIRVGHTLGASAVVTGRVEASDTDLVLSARLVRLDTGRLEPEIVRRGPPGELFSIVAVLAAELAEQATLPARWSPPPSPAAFELYVKGLMADEPDARIGLLEEALSVAPGYDLARLALWQLHTEQAAHQRALDVLSLVGADRPASREARFRSALSLLNLKRVDDAFKRLAELHAEAPHAAIANALGVIQLRRRAATQAGRATYYFNQATELEPADADYFFNLGYAYWLDKDARAAAYWFREAVRRAPADGDAHYLLGVALGQSGASTEAARERELALRLSSAYADWEARASSGGELVPRGLERLHTRLRPAASRVDAVITASGQRDQAELARFHLEAGRRAMARDADREALQALRRTIYLSPYLAEAHLLVGRLHLRGGRPEEAVQALKIAIWSEETAEAQLVLAEAYLELENTALARVAVDRALVLDPGSAEARSLRGRLGPGGVVLK